MRLTEFQLRALKERLDRNETISVEQARADAMEHISNAWLRDREAPPDLSCDEARADAMEEIQNAWRRDESRSVSSVAQSRASTRIDRARPSMRTDGIAERDFRTDFLAVPPKMTPTDEGYLRGDAIITRTGVFTYRNADGTVRRELRHPDDVFDQNSMKSFEMLPITVSHPSAGRVDATNAKNFAVGHLGERITPEGDQVRASLIVTAQDGIEAIRRGVRQLSCGYSVELVPERGTYRGDDYDHRQTNIRGNHVALVDVGRAGPEARLNLDAALSESERLVDKARNDAMEEIQNAWRR